jgi:hypothetical protein
MLRDRKHLERVGCWRMSYWGGCSPSDVEHRDEEKLGDEDAPECDSAKVNRANPRLT